MTDATENLGQPEATAEKIGKGWLMGLSAAELIAVFTVLTIIASFLWEWGYWSVFGISISEMPLSFENLASVVSAWLPWVLFWIMPGFFLRFPAMLRKMEKDDKIRQQLKGGPVERAKAAVTLVKNNNTLSIVVSCLLISIAFFALYQVITEKGVHPFIMYGVAVFILRGYTMRACKSFATLKAIRIIWGVSYVFLFGGYFYAVGRTIANVEVNGFSNLAQISIKMREAQVEKEMLILRNNHDFVYAYDPKFKKLMIMPWHSIAHISFDSEVNVNVAFPPRIPNILFPDNQQR